MQRTDLLPRLEKLIGAKVELLEQVQGGYTPALRLRCHTASGTFFAKVGATPLTCSFLRREIDMYTRIQGDFMPKLVGWEDDETQPVLIIEDLSDWQWPPPWNERRIELVLEQVAVMHNTPADIETFSQVHGDGGGNWASVAADPGPFLSLGIASGQWLETALPALVRYSEGCSTAGNSLAHWDLRSDNICLRDTRALFVDWNLACLSNPRLDLGFWLPSLAFEGGPLPERILPDAPDVAAWVAGFFASRAGLPGIPDAPRVRLVQRQQLDTALSWAIRALNLPPLRS